MKFLFPLGLIGLIGIPILIFVYIIKNRYTEQTVSSTYMWKLSERFIKRRNPLSRITGLISLILQLLLVLCLSLAVAQPLIIIPNQAKEYCFIVDGSGSMQTEVDGKTRLDIAKEEVKAVIDGAKNGSIFSLVFVSDMTEKVFELEDDRELIKKRIDLLEASDGSVDYVDTIGVAQKYFNENASVITYLVTDTEYAEHENINLINVARAENNISLENVTYEDAGSGTVIVSGEVISYSLDAVTDVEIYSNVSSSAIGTQRLQLVKNVKTPFSVICEAGDFYSLTVKLTASDTLNMDNSITIYNIEKENAYRVLLVSDTPFLLQAAVNSVGVADLTVMSTAEYGELVEALNAEDKVVSGYGLYIYDACSPKVAPTDGTVWFVGPPSNIENTGFSIQGEVELDEGVVLEHNESPNSLVKQLTLGMTGDDIYVKKFIKCGLYGDFHTILSYMGNPIVFTGVGDSGNREVVFAFNFHDSDNVLSIDYLILLNNLLKYSFPAVIEKTEYTCGDMAQINVLPGCTSIRVEAPSGEVIYADTSSAISEFELTEVGNYRLVLDVSGTEREFYLSSALPLAERCTEGVAAQSVSIRGTAVDGGRDAMYDPMIILFSLAAVLFLAEWMVYCYDKYQFR